MLLNNELFDILTSEAKASPRLRKHFDLRNSVDDLSQRMLNALEPGTVMPIHRHMNSSETVVVLRGKVRWNYYNDDGELTNSYIVEPMSEIIGLCVPKGQWHSLESLKSGSIVLATQEGPYAPMRVEDIMNRKINDQYFIR